MKIEDKICVLGWIGLLALAEFNNYEFRQSFCMPKHDLLKNIREYQNIFGLDDECQKYFDELKSDSDLAESIYHACRVKATKLALERKNLKFSY